MAVGSGFIILIICIYAMDLGADHGNEHLIMRRPAISFVAWQSVPPASPLAWSEKQ